MVFGKLGIANAFQLVIFSTGVYQDAAPIVN
jgi:hypothetical protein